MWWRTRQSCSLLKLHQTSAGISEALTVQRCHAGKPARGLDVVEDKTELASLLEAEKSRRRLLEQRFSTVQEEADKLRYGNCWL